MGIDLWENWASKGLIALLALATVVRGQSDTLVVELEDQGFVKGHKDETGTFYRFLDIPYATAPTGSNKFKGPLPPRSWPGTLDAVYRGITCTQPFRGIHDKQRFTISYVSTQDDCLIANVFVPETENKNLPVLVHVHGGAHIFGRGELLYSNLVQRKDIIVVTFNYRLGFQGFLCLGTKDVPGNAGMKDQVALLRWVQKNIANFGGDPNDVTVEGCSTGASCVDLLTISPMAAGLFHKAVIASGSAFGYTGVATDPLKSAKLFASRLNFTNVDDIAALENFYKTTPNKVINYDAMTQFDNSVMLFAPCVERDTGTGEEIFLSESPYNMVHKGQYNKMPLLYGFVEFEGLFHKFFFGQYDAVISGMAKNFSHYLPKDLQFKSDAERDTVANTVRNFYFPQKIDHDSIFEYSNYFTDYMFVYPMMASLRMRRGLRNDTAFVYKFMHENIPFFPNSTMRYVHHCAQWELVCGKLDHVTPKDQKTPEYLLMQEKLRKIWFNFIKYGVPVPESNPDYLPTWPPVDKDWSPYMILRNNNTALTNSSNTEISFHLWDEIYKKHYRHPIPPAPTT